MSKNSSSSTKKKKTTSEIPDEVEELLKAAQDDVLLKLTINSHMAHSSSQNFTIDPDLDSRFQSLKSKKSKSKLPRASAIDAEKKNPKKDLDEGDDILARFSALKKSLPSYSESASGGSGVGNINQSKEHLMDDNDDDEEDEVEKVIKWAKDAARLDPSPPSDVEDSDDDDDGDTEEDSEEEVFAEKTSKRR